MKADLLLQEKRRGGAEYPETCLQALADGDIGPTLVAVGQGGLFIVEHVQAGGLLVEEGVVLLSKDRGEVVGILVVVSLGRCGRRFGGGGHGRRLV